MLFVVAALALTAQPTAPQAPAPARTAAAPAEPSPAAQQAIATAAEAWSNCLRSGVAGAPATGTADAAATAVMARCSTQQSALETAVNGIIVGLPADQQAAAREQMRTQIAAVPAQLAGGITQMRASHTAAPAASPAH